MLNFILLIPLFFSHFAKAEAPATSDVKYQKAVTAYEKGLDSQALNLFKDSMATKDKNIRKKSLYMQGCLMAKLGQHEDAIDTFKRLAQKYPKDSYADDAMYWQAKIKYIQFLQERSKVWPVEQEWDYYYNAESERPQSRKDTLKEISGDFIAVSKKYPKGDMSEAAFYMAIRTATMDQKIKLLKQMIKRHPDSTMVDDPMVNGFMSYGREDDLKKQNTELYKYLKKGNFKNKTKLGKARLSLLQGLLSLRLGNPSAAVKPLRKALKNVNEPGNFKKTQGHFNLDVETPVNDIYRDIYLHLSNTYAKLGKHKQYLDLLQDWKKAHPNEDTVYSIMVGQSLQNHGGPNRHHLGTDREPWKNTAEGICGERDMEFLSTAKDICDQNIGRPWEKQELLFGPYKGYRNPLKARGCPYIRLHHLGCLLLRDDTSPEDLQEHSQGAIKNYTHYISVRHMIGTTFYYDGKIHNVGKSVNPDAYDRLVSLCKKGLFKIPTAKCARRR